MITLVLWVADLMGKYPPINCTKFIKSNPRKTPEKNSTQISGSQENLFQQLDKWQFVWDSLRRNYCCCVSFWIKDGTIVVPAFRLTLGGTVEDWADGPTMDQGSRLTVDEEWEEGPTMDWPLRHAASTAKGHCNVTIFYHVSNKVTISWIDSKISQYINPGKI